MEGSEIYGNPPYLKISYIAPKNIQITNIEVPEIAWKGEETEIAVTVNNSDEIDYSGFNLTVSVDGSIIYENTSFSIGASEGKTVSILWTPEELGTHEVSVILKDEDGVLLSQEVREVTVGAIVPIQEIQSNTTNGDASAYVDVLVKTRGFVTALDHWTTSYGAHRYGFFIQNGTGPWRGIFVYTYDKVPTYNDSSPVKVGDVVEVVGTVKESSGLTEISYVSSITKLDSNDSVEIPRTSCSQDWRSLSRAVGKCSRRGQRRQSC
nr:CARDB domain-containing protein [Thermococcus radiotolerans]